MSEKLIMEIHKKILDFILQVDRELEQCKEGMLKLESYRADLIYDLNNILKEE